ncbi:MAG: hypothetical protein PHF00_01750 [Elusimicrobia bacterium]|nr:hypothetical protein [Elusimicrobiota bacterium]
MNEERPADDNDPAAGSSVDIPDLKKRQKERRKAGAAWWSPRSPNSPFAGASGGRGIAGAARSAASVAGAPSEIVTPAAATWLRGLTASMLGKALVGVGALTFVSGLGLYAYNHLYASREDASVTPYMGPLSSSMQVRMADSNRLEYAAAAGRGTIKFEQTKTPNQVERLEAPATEEAPPTELSDTNGIDSVQDRVQDRMAHDLSGSRLSASMGAEFGGKNIFASMTGLAPRFGQGVDRSRLLNFPVQKGKKGKMGKMRSSLGSRRASALTGGRVRVGRAIAQAKFARGMSLVGANSRTEEAMRAEATGAFEQNHGTGGTMPGVDTPVNPNSSVNPAGGLGEKPFDLPDPPETPNGQNVTPYQDPLNSALNLGAIAGMLKLLSLMLIAIGLILIAVGIALMCNPFTMPIGAALLGAGIALLMMGMMMLMMAMALAGIAKGLGKNIGSQYGQDYQEDIVDECMDQAVNKGTRPQNCTPQTQPNPPKTTIEEDVRRQREANFELETGQPLQ